MIFKGYRPCRRPLSKQGVKMRGAVQAPANAEQAIRNAVQAGLQR